MRSRAVSIGLDEPLLGRFMGNVADDPAGCWMWTARKNPGGYGLFYARGTRAVAHRVAYEHFVGLIPPGMSLDHLCRNRACVNPAHLEPVANKENILRGESFAAVNARKKVCVRGHQLTGDGVKMVRRGRQCVACQRRMDRESKARKAARLRSLESGET